MHARMYVDMCTTPSGFTDACRIRQRPLDEHNAFKPFCSSSSEKAFRSAAEGLAQRVRDGLGVFEEAERLGSPR